MEFDVKKIAKSARLKITKEEEIILKNSILDIINMIERLNQIDLVDFGSANNNKSFEDILLQDLPSMKYRDDIATKSMSNKELISNAPKSLAGCIIVPKIVE
ncbi:MAG: Asp-tRNA(Asn)/Glu-tRNA(Gln) amidotransferase subunit GatC [Oscillospiraceae bacterium]|nr:Asp-tRNA(Asn)/Glu-tRNA(Gln) amidotransferase subunit GatC [Oscillospiraceae bacterium]